MQDLKIAPRGSLPPGKTAIKNIERTVATLTARGIDPDMEDYVVDLGTGVKCISGVFRRNEMPTVTASRGSCLDYWFTRLRRRITISELIRTQGMDETRLNVTISDRSEHNR